MKIYLTIENQDPCAYFLISNEGFYLSKKHWYFMLEIDNKKINRLIFEGVRKPGSLEYLRALNIARRLKIDKERVI